MTKIRGNYSQFMQYIFVVDFVPALWRKKKLIKQKKTLKKKNTSQRERERSGPEAHQSVWSRLEFTERERERERETLL